MKRQPIINPSRFQAPNNDPVVIEYDRGAKRVTTTLKNSYAARKRWIELDAAGKNPKVVRKEVK